MSKEKIENGSGMFLCDCCQKPVDGKAVVGYRWESDYAEDHIIVHQDCAREFKAKQKGLIHKCPKCVGHGELTHREISFDLIDPKTTVYKCSLCGGDGYLAKPPIPVIVDWKKAE